MIKSIRRGGIVLAGAAAVFVPAAPAFAAVQVQATGEICNGRVVVR